MTWTPETIWAHVDYRQDQLRRDAEAWRRGRTLQLARQRDRSARRRARRIATAVANHLRQA